MERIVQILEIAAGIGYIFGPLIGTFLFNIGGFPLPFLIIGLLMLVF